MQRTLATLALTLAAPLTASLAAASGIPPEAIFSVRDTDNDGRGDMLGGSLTLATRGGFEQSVMAEFRNPYHHEGRVEQARVWVTIAGSSNLVETGGFRFAAYSADGAVSVADFEAAAVAETTRSFPNWAPYFETFEIDLTAAFIAAQERNEDVIGVRISLVSEAPTAATVIDASSWFTYERPCPVNCPGDYDQSGGIDGDDISAFIWDWQEGHRCADFDGSGGVDVDDLGYFLYMWQHSCC